MQYIIKNPMDMKYAARRIKEARTALNYTQKELAELTGITHAMVSLYENARVLPRLDVLISMAKALCVPLDYFVLSGGNFNTFHNTENLTRREIKQIQEFIDTLIGYKKDNDGKKKKV